MEQVNHVPLTETVYGPPRIEKFNEMGNHPLNAGYDSDDDSDKGSHSSYDPENNISLIESAYDSLQALLDEAPKSPDIIDEHPSSSSPKSESFFARASIYNRSNYLLAISSDRLLKRSFEDSSTAHLKRDQKKVKKVDNGSRSFFGNSSMYDRSLYITLGLESFVNQDVVGRFSSSLVGGAKTDRLEGNFSEQHNPKGDFANVHGVSEPKYKSNLFMSQPVEHASNKGWPDFSDGPIYAHGDGDAYDQEPVYIPTSPKYLPTSSSYLPRSTKYYKTDDFGGQRFKY